MLLLKHSETEWIFVKHEVECHKKVLCSTDKNQLSHIFSNKPAWIETVVASYPCDEGSPLGGGYFQLLNPLRPGDYALERLEREKGQGWRANRIISNKPSIMVTK